MRKFSLSTDDGTVAIEMAVPAGWTEDAAMSNADGPQWKLAGARMLSLAAIAPTGDAEVKMRKAIRMQYGEGAPGAERTDLDGGRVWMQRKEDANLHARIFVPYEGGVVMGVAILGEDGVGKLPEIKQAFETIKIQ